MNEQTKLMQFCDQAMFVSLCIHIFFLPVSIALVESFSGFTIFFFLLKRGQVFWLKKRFVEANGNSREPINYVGLFLESYKPKFSYLNQAVMYFMFFTFISVVTSQYPLLGIRGFVGKIVQDVFLFFGFIECMNNKKRIKVFLGVLLISSAMVCINGMIQYIFGKGLLRGFLIDDGRVRSSFHQSNDFAAYLVVIVPTLLCLIIMPYMKQLREKFEIPKNQAKNFLFTTKGKVLLIGLFVLNVICLGLTYSRAAWLVFAISLTFLSFRYKTLRVWFLILFVVFVAIFFPKMINERESPIFDDSGLFYVSERNIYWQEALRVIYHFPIYGSGYNSYSMVAPKFKIIWGGYPHNSYLHLAAETGLIGIGAFLWMLWSLYIYSYHKLNYIKDPLLFCLLTGLLSGYLSFLVFAFFDTTFYSVQLNNFMWVVMGLIVAIQKDCLKEGEHEDRL